MPTPGFGSVAAYYFLDDFALNNPVPNWTGRGDRSGLQCHDAWPGTIVESRHYESIGANAVNEFHFSYMRFANNAGQPLGGVGPSLASARIR